MYGVVKAYTTRVGDGPFPSELKDVSHAILNNVQHFIELFYNAIFLNRKLESICRQLGQKWELLLVDYVVAVGLISHYWSILTRLMATRGNKQKY